MAEGDKIQIDVEFSGAQQAATQLGQVARGLGEVDTQADAASQATARMAGTGLQLTQRVQAVAGAVQGLVSQLGSRDRTAGLVSSIAGATAQFAAMGSMLGPAGTVVGAVIGFGSAVAGLAQQANDLATAARSATEDVVTLTEAMAEASARSRLNLAVADASEYAAEIDRINAALTTNAETIAGMRDEYSRIAPEDEAMYSSLRREGVALRSQLEDIRALSRISADEEAAIMAEDLAAAPSSGRAPARRSGGGVGASSGMSSEEQSWLDDVSVAAAMAEEEQRIAEETAAALERIKAEQMERERAADEERLAEQQKLADEELEIWERQAAEMERLGAEQEAQRREADASALEDRQQMAGELTGLLGQTTAALGKAVGSIILGEKSTEEAFKGLAAAFLEMISQYASLKAATEFADAAASFARYDFGGGAAHVGAGLAFTAVAVATGIGAAAINSPPQAPARPEAGQQPTEGGGGGDVIINWSSPVVTAITRAELGRDISGLVAEAGAI